MIRVRLDSPIPIGEQILQGIRRLIAAGDLAPGDELPTVRQLAADLGVNLNTVARGYSALEDAGLVRSIRGRGTRVTAAAETNRGSRADLRRRVAARLAEGLADAKLASLDRDEVERLLDELVEDYWPRTRQPRKE